MPRLEPPQRLPRIISSPGSTTFNRTSSWRNLVPRIDLALCTGCLLCWKFCPEACVGLPGPKPEIGMDYCKGCGVCAQECPAECISMDQEAEA
ncbi:MAG: 4Fe-4S binding protein [Elusimicrobia bacterium]|nr:4Fe-4S binding protein [Elusimicrobiota bacterium]